MVDSGREDFSERHGRKRILHEHFDEINHPATSSTASSHASGQRPSSLVPTTAAPGERPTKRRRLGQASVLCMRELFRAVVKDGEIKEEDRLVLHNTALLLSQVDGKTWVNFSDTDGELKDFTPPQLKLLRPFLEKVAHELKEHEVNVHSLDTHSKEEVIDCLRLADVPWAEGITARELMGCCAPDEDIMASNGLLKMIVSRLPAKYMMRSRVRELVNYYYLRRSLPDPVKRRRRSRGLCGDKECCGCVRRAAALVFSFLAGVFGPCWSNCRLAVVYLFGTASALVACTVVAMATGLVSLLTCLGVVAGWFAAGCSQRKRHSSHDGIQGPGSDHGPFWPAMRFFIAAMLHTQSKEVFKFLVMVARLRVFVCLGTCNRFFGWILFPLVFVTEKVLKLGKGNVLLGCVCDDSDSISLISWLPQKVATGLVWLLCLARQIPFLDFATEPFVEIVELSQPFLVFILDVTFSMGIAQGLAKVVDLADEQAQQKLVWMSMGISRMVREGHGTASALASNGALASQSLPPSMQTAPMIPSGEGIGHSNMQVDTPAWSEDGTWNLFD